MIQIVPWHNRYNNSIAELMSTIAKEFAEPITRPDTVNIPAPASYWLATHTNKVIGTVGFDSISNRTAVLRRLFLQSTFRGKEKGIAELLLKTAVDACKKNNIDFIYLGTMAQFTGAQRFYQKHGFTRVEKNALPADFPMNPLDSLFYCMNLNTAN